jgi:site-specific DNA-adenine methylase
MTQTFRDDVDEGLRVYQLLQHGFNGKWGKYVKQRGYSYSTLKRMMNDKLSSRLVIRHRDVFDVLRNPEGDALYLDPPYLVKERRYAVADHSLEFHRKLADALRSCATPFALSLNDTPEARELYSWCATLNPKPNELLFLWPREWWSGLQELEA